MAQHNPPGTSRKQQPSDRANTQDSKQKAYPNKKRDHRCRELSKSRSRYASANKSRVSNRRVRFRRARTRIGIAKHFSKVITGEIANAARRTLPGTARAAAEPASSVS